MNTDIATKSTPDHVPAPTEQPSERKQAAEALQILAKAGAEFRGTLRDHEIIHAAVQILDKVITTYVKEDAPKAGE